MKNQAATDYTNFLTVQDILHPEVCHVTAPPHIYDEPTIVVIDEPHAPQYHNRWDIVWAEATVMNGTNIDASSSNGSIPVNNTNATVQLPTNGTALDNNAENDALQPSTVPTTEATTTSASTTNPVIINAPYHHGNLLEVIIGMSFAIAAVVGTFAFEISTMIVYILATVLHKSALACQQNHSILLGFVLQICAFVFLLTAKCLMLIDFTLFIGSITYTESIAISVGIVNSILTCFSSGIIWHQYIRKLCHLTRWAFRDIYPSKDPQRIFPLCRQQGRPPPVQIAENPSNNQTTTLNPKISTTSDPTVFEKE